jgi:hypothetical protein
MSWVRNIALSIFWFLISVHLLHAQDLSSYRGFRFAMSLAAAAKQAGLKPSEARVIHRPPALIQELNWHPSLSRRSSRSLADPVWNTLFSFYNGELFRIVVNYNPHQTEGLTTKDIVDALSAEYGPATDSAGPSTFSLSQVENDTKLVIAHWEDSLYSFSLFRSSYQANFGLIAVSKQLDALARAATVEAIRTEMQQPPREVEHEPKQDEEDRSVREKSRSMNNSAFRP